MKIEQKIIAHRGIFNNKDIPENSICSFKKALDKNFSIELDVRLTKDCVLVVYHDNNLKRLTGKDEKISELTYEEIKKLYLLETKEKIPTLEEVLNLVDKKVLIDIEIKEDQDISKIGNILIDILKNYKGEYLIKSFDPRIVRWFKKNYPEVKRGLLINDKYSNKIIEYILKSRFIIWYTKPNFIAVSKKIISNKKIQSLRKTCPVFVWTMEDRNEMNMYKDLSDIYICNNLPY